MGRNKTAALGYLKEKLRKRLQACGTKFLSRAGKEILIKTVAQALPSYAMSLFLLPLEIFRDMESMMAKYWWQSSSNFPSSIHWMSWKCLCGHKSKGGMSFRNLRDFNLSLLGKQGWRLMANQDSLVSRVFIARYFPHGSFLTATLGPNPSFVWCSILEAQSLVKQGSRWVIGDGKNISILGEPWLPDEENPLIISNHPSLNNAKVCNFLSMDGSGREIDILEDLLVHRDVQLVQSIPFQSRPGEDVLTWLKDSSGIYTVRSAYKLLHQLSGDFTLDVSAEDKFWKKLWQLKTPPKMKNLVWRAAKGCLPTMSQRLSKKVNVTSACPICSMDVETTLHALVSCLVAAAVWNRVGIGTLLHQQMSFLDWNDKVWQNKSIGVESIVVSATNYLNQCRIAQKSSNELLFSGYIPGDGAEQWNARMDNSIKVNVDTSVFSDSSSYGVGFVARDCGGFLVHGRWYKAFPWFNYAGSG
uniref:Reverse transcriptase zinc-binding domain-containing protein n=1 Tax=Cannabis sativa TaxID=3483 RepID=A0A803Q2B6_CANSA